MQKQCKTTIYVYISSLLITLQSVQFVVEDSMSDMSSVLSLNEMDNEEETELSTSSSSPRRAHQQGETAHDTHFFMFFSFLVHDCFITLWHLVNYNVCNISEMVWWSHMINLELLNQKLNQVWMSVV